jgi:transposase-like protein
MEIFKGESLIKFTDRFPSDEACLKYLSDIKWNKGFKCKKCGHLKFSERTKHERCCTLCKHIESPTSGTLFHKVKFGIRKAFFITFEMTASTKGLSASQVAKRYEITRKTAWLFMHKVRNGMESSQSFPIEGTVQVDEFVVGGKENNKQGRSYNSKKKKVVCAVELSEDEKVKRVYAIRIEDYSSKSLRKIFEKHISQTAQVKTDEWKGYRPIQKDYNIKQTISDTGQNFRQVHIIIHQIKSWLRTNFSWVHKGHIDKYLNEYSYRINRSIYKETIFHKLIERMLDREHLGYLQIKISS